MTDRRARLRNLLKIAFTAVVLTVLFARVDLGQVRHQLAAASPPLALLAFALLMLRNLVLAWRWGRVLRAWERPLPLTTLLRLVLVGAFFTLTMPTAAGGDVARWTLVPRHRVGRLIAAQSVLCDRLIGLAGLGFLASLALPLAWDLVPGPWLRLVVLALLPGSLAAAAVLARPDRIPRRWRTRWPLSRVPLDRAPRPRALVAAGLGAVLTHVVAISAVVIMGRALGDDTPAVAYAALLPVVWLASMLPVSVGGLGVREAGFVALFVAAGMPEVTAVAIAGLWLTMTLGQALIGGALWLGVRSAAAPGDAHQRPAPAVVPAGAGESQLAPGGDPTDRIDDAR